GVVVSDNVDGILRTHGEAALPVIGTERQITQSAIHQLQDVAGAADPAPLSQNASWHALASKERIGRGCTKDLPVYAVGHAIGSSSAIAKAEADVGCAEVVQQTIQVNVLVGVRCVCRDEVQDAVRVACGSGPVDVVFQAGVSGFGVSRSRLLCAVGAGQHSPAVGEVENVSVLS